MNEFDKGLGYYNGMGGGVIKKFLKKIDKSRRTIDHAITKTVKKVLSPISHAILPKAVRKIGEDMDRKGINKIGAAIAVSVISGGAGAPLLAKIAGSAVAKAAIKSGTKDYKTVKVNQAVVAQETQAAGAIGDAVKQLPEFQEVVTKLRTDGYTEPEIAAHWAESKAFYQTSLNTVKAAVTPTVTAEVKKLNIPDEARPAVVESVVNQIAETSTQEAKETVTGNKGALYALAAVVALALVGGA